jgi:hypothetical protein
MVVGRMTSARQLWEALWYSHWDALPAVMARSTQRLHVNAGGHEAFVCYQQRLYDPRSADVYCWSPRALSQQLFFALRDRAYRQGYRTLFLLVTDKTAALIGSDGEAAPHQQTVYYRDLR